MVRGKKKLNIGVLTHNFPIYPDERKDSGAFVLDFSNELAGHESVFVLCPDILGEKYEYKKVSVEWFGWLGSGKKFGSWSFYSPMSVFRFFSLMYFGVVSTLRFNERNSIDFNLAMWALPSGIFAWVAKLRYGTSYGVWCLGSDINLYAKVPILRFLIKKTLRNADWVWANSRVLCEKVEQLAGVKCEFLSTQVSLKAAAGKVSVDKETVNFLFVGRLEKVKGPDILIGALSELVKTCQNWKVYIGGDGSMKSELVEMVDRLDLSTKVKFLGRLDEAGVIGYMKACDYLIIPSRSESLPVVVMEAANCNLPVISARVGDLGEIVVRYNIGYTFDAGDTKALAKIMVEVMKSGKATKRSFLEGMRRYSLDFKQEKSVGKFLDTIR